MNSAMCKVEVRDVPEDAKMYIVASCCWDSLGCDLIYETSFNDSFSAIEYIAENISDENVLIFTYGRV